MYCDYFKGNTFRYIVIVISVIFIVPFAGLQLYLGGKLLDTVTENLINPTLASWMLGLIICAYVGLGGIKSVAYNNAFKFIIIIFGIIILGLISYNLTGGFTSLNQSLAKLTLLKENGIHRTISLFSMPEVINLNSGYDFNNEKIEWTSALIFTFVLSTVGIFCAPAFTMWCFSSESPKPFASQQVWVMTFFVGFVLIFFTTFLGISSHFLGSNAIVNDAGINISKFLSEYTSQTNFDLNLFIN